MALITEKSKTTVSDVLDTKTMTLMSWWLMVWRAVKCWHKSEHRFGCWAKNVANGRLIPPSTHPLPTRVGPLDHLTGRWLCPVWHWLQWGEWVCRVCTLYAVYSVWHSGTTAWHGMCAHVSPDMAVMTAQTVWTQFGVLFASLCLAFGGEQSTVAPSRGYSQTTLYLKAKNTVNSEQSEHQSLVGNCLVRLHFHWMPTLLQQYQWKGCQSCAMAVSVWFATSGATSDHWSVLSAIAWR